MLTGATSGYAESVIEADHAAVGARILLSTASQSLGGDADCRRWAGSETADVRFEPAVPRAVSIQSSSAGG